MPLYIFKCPSHGLFERLCPIGTSLAECCPEWGPVARSYDYSPELGYRFGIGSPAVDERGMFRRFREASAELADKGISTSGIWEQSKRQANAMVAAGESPARLRESVS